MNETYGTPYMEGFPIGDRAVTQYQQRITGILKGKDPVNDTDEIPEISDTNKKGLIVADAIIGLSIKKYLRQHGIAAEVMTVSGRFEGAEYTMDEDEITEKINETYDFVMADPLILDLVRSDAMKIVLPHYAVSSRVCKNQNWNYLEERNYTGIIESLSVNADIKQA